mmetsp:Transcript_30396/g.48558  ORF Transcript_30396/g.48558 Transcript_30396/m.48558 type:complete len:444 (-) Transcript_30396:156-1487(-)
MRYQFLWSLVVLVIALTAIHSVDARRRKKKKKKGKNRNKPTMLPTTAAPTSLPTKAPTVHTPVVAVASIEFNKDSKTEMVYGNYPRWLNDAGAKVIRIPMDATHTELKELLSKVNMVLFQGASKPGKRYINMIYFITNYILKQFKDSGNDGTSVVPIVGICYGQQRVMAAISKRRSIIKSFKARNISLPVHLYTQEDEEKSPEEPDDGYVDEPTGEVEEPIAVDLKSMKHDFDDNLGANGQDLPSEPKPETEEERIKRERREVASRHSILDHLSDEDLATLVETPSTHHNHFYGISPDVIKKNRRLQEHIEVVATSMTPHEKKNKQREFITIAQGKNGLPVYLFQSHPETSKDFGDGFKSQRVNEKFAEFLVRRARLNKNRWPDEEELESLLLENTVEGLTPKGQYLWFLPGSKNKKEEFLLGDGDEDYFEFVDSDTNDEESR